MQACVAAHKGASVPTKSLIIVILLFCISGTVAAKDLLVKDYKKVRTEPQIEMYLEGMEAGFRTANAMQELHKREPLYCQPNPLALGVENIARFIDSFLEKHPAISDSMPIPSICNPI